LNLTTAARQDTVTLTVDDWNLEAGHTYYLNNLLEGTSQAVQPDQIAELIENLPASGVKVYAITDTAVTLDVPDEIALPKRFALYPNYPNPFNPDTQIRFELPESVPVKLVIYNVLGQQVRSLVNRRMQPGSHTVMFDGRSNDGIPLASGVYFYRLEAGRFVKNRKMVLLK
ncbi:MAG: T9SS type A sorting domain-containing protein, partial [bacterium]